MIISIIEIIVRVFERNARASWNNIWRFWYITMYDVESDLKIHLWNETLIRKLSTHSQILHNI